nr:reverse transcriptase domain-containing protein [Tanacetum cinerariifolium]
MADQRTMAQLLQAPTEGYEDAIVVPTIIANNSELKHGLLTLVQNKQLYGLDKEDPHAHIRYFNKIISTLKFPNVPNTLRNEITNFQQRFDETFSEACDRFKDLLRACPHHGFSELHQLDMFYNASNSKDQDSLNSAAGGNFLDKMPCDCLSIIESKSKVHYSRDKPVVARVSTTVSTSGVSPDFAELKDLVRALLLDKKGQSQSSALVKAVEESCVTCGGANSYRICPATNGNVYRDNIHEYVSQASENWGNNFNQGLVYQPSVFQQPAYQAPAYQAPSPQSQGVSKEDFLAYVKANDAVMKNMQTQGQNMQNQLTNLTDLITKFVKDMYLHSPLMFPAIKQLAIKWWDEYGFVIHPELHQLDTFYNASNSKDQDSLNSAVGGNFLDKMHCDCLSIIESKSKVRYSRDKPVVSRVSMTASTSGVSPDVAELKDLVRALLLDKKGQSQSPTLVKAVEESCVTCGGAHSYKICPATNGNVYRDNIHEYVSQASANWGNNFNQGLVYQPPVFQQPAYQAPAYQAPSPQTQGVLKEDFLAYVKANDAVMKNMQTQGQNMQNQLTNLTDLITKFVNSNNASTSSPGTLPRNTIANPKSDLKAITTRNGVSYDGPQIPPSVVENKPEVIKDTVNPTNNENTKEVQPRAVQSKPVTSEPTIALVSASKPNPKASTPYPSRRNDERNREKAKDQIEKFYQIFKDTSFEISFVDALILMPKFASTLKALIGNKEKLSEMVRTLLNEHCSAVLHKKLPEKLGDLGKFLILCNFPGMAECLALADLGASINLMPLSVWKKISLPKLTPTCMTLELADRLISRPVGVAEDVYVKVGSFHFPAEFVVVDFDANPRVPLIIRRSFLKPERALIDVFEGELTLRVGKEAITFNLDQTSRYSANYSDMTAKRIDVIDMACEEYSQEVLSFFDTISMVELKALPPHLEYAFLEGDDKLPVIIAKDLSVEEKTALITVLKSHKRAIAWKLSDIKGINPGFCTHKILMEEDFTPAVQHQRRVNLKIHGVIKQEEFISKLSLPFRKDAEKRKLTEAPILIALDWDMPFELMCDASDFVIGAVLGQRQDKHFRPIHYASKTLTEAKSKYTTTKKEMLAVVYAFEKFRSYLILNQSIVYTDHSVLKYLFAKKDSKARLLRWVLLLQEFTFKVVDTKGAKNLAADHLPRLEKPHQNMLDPK